MNDIFFLITESLNPKLAVRLGTVGIESIDTQWILSQQRFISYLHWKLPYVPPEKEFLSYFMYSVSLYLFVFAWLRLTGSL